MHDNTILTKIKYFSVSQYLNSEKQSLHHCPSLHALLPKVYTLYSISQKLQTY